jgi:AraC family transcriptional regulator
MPAEAPIRRVRLSSLPHDHLAESGFRLRLITDPPGVLESPGFPNTIVWVHYGTAAYVKCRRADSSHRGMAVHGDIDIIPADTPAVWETKEPDTGISLMVSSQLMSSVAEQCDLDPSRVEIRNRFQVRDPQLENIAWALKAEIECGYPSGRLYLDSLAVAAAARLVRAHSSAAPEPGARVGRIPDRRLRPVLAYIEENLARDVSLAELAAVAGLSVTHLKSLFRESAGLPAHQYLIRRRVERAKSLLGETELSISQVALETGFAHQSHLAHHMRRVLGVSPKALRDMLR